MEIATIVRLLLSNDKSKWMETTRIILKVADNILSDPFNSKFRTLKKSNRNIQANILNVRGGPECLRFMGFKEDDAGFVLDLNAPLENLEKVIEELSRIQKMPVTSQPTEQSLDKVKIECVPMTSTQKQPSMPKAGSSKEVKKDESMSDDGEITEDSDFEDPEPGPIILLPNRPGEDCGACKKKVSHGHLPENVPTVKLPESKRIFKNNFLQTIFGTHHLTWRYLDAKTRERALAVIPQERLEKQAVEKMRQLQSQVKKGQCEDPNVSLQDFMVMELLAWFKGEFFEWVDHPCCTYCGCQTEFIEMSSDKKWLVHTDRVEVHNCTFCCLLTPFPRYNDPNILLITRQGRCGEWANVFTLMCIAMKWDARIVYDQTDHVWTEVYLEASKRWVHCDPCENAFDTPLMYENGWGKKLTYCIAYSVEEVQDVTWRYSSKHKEVLARRNLCREQELVDAIVKLRLARTWNLRTPARINYLLKRSLGECIELMIEKDPTEKDAQGRTSGSLSWRLKRSEIKNGSNYTWILKKLDSDVGDIRIQYSTGLDQYQYVAFGAKPKIVLSIWHAGVFHSEGVFRKEEMDWKKTYLARTETSSIGSTGSISWKFVLDNPDKVIDIIDLQFKYEVYEDGKVEVEIKGDNATIKLPQEHQHNFTTSALTGSKTVTVTARMSYGKGQHYWQHAQLFRDSLKSKSYPFCILFKFKSIK